MFRKRREPQSDIRIPQKLLVARDADTQELLAYASKGGTYYVGFTSEPALHSYWQERGASGYVSGEIEAIELMEIVAKEADGLAIDPGASDSVALGSKDARRWLKHPRAEIVDAQHVAEGHGDSD